MSYKPEFGDIAHVGHVELLTPDLEKSANFFKDVIGLHESGRAPQSVYLRAWGDYERHTLQLTLAALPGLGHVAFRMRSGEVLQEIVNHLKAHGVSGEWKTPSFGHGPAFRFRSPDDHLLELYFATERHEIKPGERRAFKNLPQGYVARGIAPKRLDHLNLLASDVKACREFFHQLLGLRITEQIIFGEEEMGA
ncbi:MAG TPA: VOC family protein, partial [Candidatus Acidoferrales bacterium]|nr:VOC family protein [Candidatus Acidoferrales bacterium]